MADIMFHLFGLDQTKLNVGRLNIQVVITLDFYSTSVHYALGREFKPQWQQTLFWLKYNIYT